MQVFDFQIPDEELNVALERIYQTKLAILECEYELHCTSFRRRLALVTVKVQTQGGVRTLGILVKESSKHELIVLSLMNKLLPYSCPRVIHHVVTPNVVWLLLENITTWIGLDSIRKMDEVLIDGLYSIQAMFFDAVQPLLAKFATLPVVSKERLLQRGNTAFADVDTLSKQIPFPEQFQQNNWEALKEVITEGLKNTNDLQFPMTLAHGNYYPNTVRMLRDPHGRVHVAVYDWQNAAIGWPQLDLVLLLDRLDVLAGYQELPTPSSGLLQGYVSRFIDEFGIDVNMFYSVYKVAYFCRMLPLMRWWMRGHLKFPTHDPARVRLEIQTKLDRIRELGATVGE